MAIISFEDWYMAGNGLPKKLYKPQGDKHDLETPLRDAWTACLACGYLLDDAKIDKAYEITLREEATAQVISFLEYSGNATSGGTVTVVSPKTTVTVTPSAGTTTTTEGVSNGYFDATNNKPPTLQTDPGTWRTSSVNDAPGATTTVTEVDRDSTTTTTVGSGTAGAVEAAKTGYRMAVQYLTERCRLFCLLARA